ncbi:MULTISPECIES: hypothetical protein [unclassified Actinotalea]|uniref:hypothetical protein n=1 Tax=unclassified Actinotalea TaxID=2638618 RepID=UPI0015F6D75C|nr:MULTISPECIES: hypothetical protein [unclassified Actinotalea]
MRVDREAVVRRHTVRVTGIEPTSPLTVGNGEVCWTVDVTGLQTFPEQFSVTDPGGGAPGTLLGTQAQWAWHSTPRPDGVDLAATRRPYRTSRGEVPYVDAGSLHGSDDSGLDVSHRWLRANPHRLDLVRVGLVTRPPGTGGGVDGEGAPRPWAAPSPSDLGAAEQALDLWTGVVESEVELAGRRLRVTTACHPQRDALAVRLVPVPDAAPGAGGPGDEGAHDVAVRLAFPYGSTSWSNAADWTRPEAHVTQVEDRPDGAVVHRRFDGAADDAYVVRLWTGARAAAVAPHELVLDADGTLDLVLEVAPAASEVPATPLDVDGVLAASRAHWPAFWRRGAALDLSGSTDPRAPELERRVVLSQYLTAIQCAGSTPPQETGLTCNSWRGRFHLEMHWWHAAHFAVWGRPDLLERSMGWYERILPAAQETARTQGYDGARWPKQVAPDGQESPSHIGPFLLWQQPHVLHLAELLRRAAPPERRGDVVARYGALVDQTARFMADVVEPTPQGFALGPPLVPAQESYADVRERATNPPFELAYWVWGLRVAQQWREHAGLPREPRWDEVADGMARPLVRDGVYPAIGVEPFTVRADHPSMVYGLGVVPDTGLLDPAVVRATLDDVLADWDWPSTWGWDYPALAMTATRLGDPQGAVDALLLDLPKNAYLPNGHNRQTDHLPLYLPGNGGLLVAVALMVAGWEGGEAPTPGFGAGWSVRHEGFVPLP